MSHTFTLHTKAGIHRSIVSVWQTLAFFWKFFSNITFGNEYINMKFGLCDPLQSQLLIWIPV